jgi:hypothetical protein
MHILPGAFIPLAIAFSVSGPVFLFRAFIRPSDRMQAVPVIWRALPLLIMVAGLAAGLVSRFYPRTLDLAIVFGTMLLSSAAAVWGWRVERALVGLDRAQDATRLFGDESK